MFAHLKEHIGNLAVYQTEISGVERNGIRTHRLQKTIVAECGKLFEYGLSLSLETFSVRDIRTVFPSFYHILNDFGRILKVNINDDKRIALCGIHTASNGILMAEVPAEGTYLDLRIFLCDSAKNLH